MFKDKLAFIKFEAEVQDRRRFFLSDESKDFIEAVRESVPRHILEVPETQRFWRSQLAHNVIPGKNGFPESRPCSVERMKPLHGKAREGRANPKGIPFLYVASDPKTAVAECRPGLGGLTTLARVHFAQPLRLVDCGTTRLAWELSADPAPEHLEASIWTQINVVFSEPVSRSDDVGEYVATQILAELFQSMGFDGVAYRSSFGQNGYNVAAFNPDIATIETCTLYRITNVSYETKLVASDVYSDVDVAPDNFVWDPLGRVKADAVQ